MCLRRRSLDGPSHNWVGSEESLAACLREANVSLPARSRHTRRFGSKHASCLKGWAAVMSRGLAATTITRVGGWLRVDGTSGSFFGTCQNHAPCARVSELGQSSSSPPDCCRNQDSCILPDTVQASPAENLSAPPSRGDGSARDASRERGLSGPPYNPFGPKYPTPSTRSSW